MVQRSIVWSLLIVALSLSSRTSLLAQTAATEVATDSTTKPQIVTFTTRQDHQNMMKQLGITKLRPGPSGNPFVDSRWEAQVQFICRSDIQNCSVLQEVGVERYPFESR